MIRARIEIREGRCLIETRGHGSAMVCAGVSALMQTVALGLHAMAKHYPRSLRVRQK